MFDTCTRNALAIVLAAVLAVVASPAAHSQDCVSWKMQSAFNSSTRSAPGRASGNCSSSRTARYTS